MSTGGYGVLSIDVCVESSALNKTILEADLRGKDINLLAIERDHSIIPNPKASTKILLNDKIICFGKLDVVKNEMCDIVK